MKNKISAIIENITMYSLIIYTNLLFIIKSTDSDIFFDIRSAKDLIEYGLDFKDHMSFIEGLKYTYHHLLYDLLIYPIYQLWGVQAIFILMFIVSSILFIVIYHFLKNKTNNKYISIIVTLIITGTSGCFLMPKAKVVSYLLLFLQFIVINNLYTKGKIKYSIISVLLSILLVNLHYSLWIFIPVFYLPYLAQMIYSFIKSKTKIKLLDHKVFAEKCSNSKLFIITFVIILLSCFISPYGFLPYTFMFDVKHYYYSVYTEIGEMSRVILIDNKRALICFIYLIILLLSKKKISMSNLCYLLGLGLVGLMARRNVSLLLVYYFVIITWTLFEDFKFKFKFKKIRINKTIFDVSITTLLVIGFMIEAGHANIFSNYKETLETSLPNETADYIIDNLDYKNAKIYNELNYGSYFAYRGIPVFVDSRLEVYLKKFNGKEDIMIQYLHMEPENLMNKYQFDYISTEGSTKMYKYMIDNDYELLYSESDAYYLFKNNKK